MTHEEALKEAMAKLHRTTATTIAELEAAISAYLKAMGSEPVAPMSDAMRLVVEYDDFLRNFTGPVDAISASDNAAIDEAYDRMVAAARASLSAPPAPARDEEIERLIPCPCTTFEQDEDCPVGSPSLLCSACSGKGTAPLETVVALAAEMLKVAEQVDELEDPFAAWESIELLKSSALLSGPELEKRPAAFEVLDREEGTYLTRSEVAAQNSGHEYNRLYRRASAEVSQSERAGSGDAVRVKHKKRGSEYVVIGIGKMQAENWQVSRDGFDQPIDMEEVVVYQSIDDGAIWIRPRKEFEDGRFDVLPAITVDSDLPATGKEGELIRDLVKVQEQARYKMENGEWSNWLDDWVGLEWAHHPVPGQSERRWLYALTRAETAGYGGDNG